ALNDSGDGPGSSQALEVPAMFRSPAFVRTRGKPGVKISLQTSLTLRHRFPLSFQAQQSSKNLLPCRLRPGPAWSPGDDLVAKHPGLGRRPSLQPPARTGDPRLFPEACCGPIRTVFLNPHRGNVPLAPLAKQEGRDVRPRTRLEDPVPTSIGEGQRPRII